LHGSPAPSDRDEGASVPSPIEQAAPSSIWPLDSLNLEAIERAAILEAIRQSGGNVTQAMRALGVARTTLYRKLKQYGIEPES
jgi:transcriptional regulator of acetoin/glycerol metabolism